VDEAVVLLDGGFGRLNEIEAAIATDPLPGGDLRALRFDSRLLLGADACSTRSRSASCSAR
jgi:hypothetical protein